MQDKRFKEFPGIKDVSFLETVKIFAALLDFFLILKEKIYLNFFKIKKKLQKRLKNIQSYRSTLVILSCIDMSDVFIATSTR